jgi:hypothetical protein
VKDHVARLSLDFATDKGRTEVSTDELLTAIEVGAYLERGYRGLPERRQADCGPARTSDLEAIARRLLTKRPGVSLTARDLIQGWPNASRPHSRKLRQVLEAMEGVQVKGQRAGTAGKATGWPRDREAPHTTHHLTHRNQRPIAVSGGLGIPGAPTTTGSERTYRQLTPRTSTQVTPGSSEKRERGGIPIEDSNSIL